MQLFWLLRETKLFIILIKTLFPDSICIYWCKIPGLLSWILIFMQCFHIY